LTQDLEAGVAEGGNDHPGDRPFTHLPSQRPDRLSRDRERLLVDDQWRPEGRADAVDAYPITRFLLGDRDHHRGGRVAGVWIDQEDRGLHRWLAVDAGPIRLGSRG